MESPKERYIREFNRVWKELDELYHDIALKIGLSDSAFTIFYSLYELGDGCLQAEICHAAFANKQTINSSIRNLEQKGYLYLKQGRGRDKHIYLTELGTAFMEREIRPVLELEDQAFLQMTVVEREQFLLLTQKYVSNLKEAGLKRWGSAEPPGRKPSARTEDAEL